MSFDYEKLGLFFLGQRYDLRTRERKPELLLYESKDLVTHGLVVGMTGSGKTGLCIDLIEEAAIDGIPSLLIDPKGDLSNLLLTFPELRPEDFLPWVNAEDAARKGTTPEEFAKAQADLWEKGLAQWHQEKSRITRLKENAEFAIYTPGSSAGRRLSILKSFAAPPTEILEQTEMLRERLTSTVAGLLGFAGINADPVKSRESILLSSILQQAWGKGQDLDLAGLIHEVQSPSMQKVGVLDLESFFPGKERFDLAMQLNNLLASPSFGNWVEGEPLNVANLLYTSTGKPRVAILSIAHLGDAERMFFVTLLLNEVLSWVRTQSGTNSLRALLYMDEIMGYFPPVANPPSKQPLLTLLKQGRAYGLGVLLATQNPVDLDYKGLANIGTWFVGRLQTERDKARVLEGLEGSALGRGLPFDRRAAEEILAGLGQRVFLLHNVHQEGFEIFESRWAMSYLRGPLSRAQIKTLSETTTPAEVTTPPVEEKKTAPHAVPAAKAPAPRPVLPPEIPQFYLPPANGGEVVFYPRVLGVAQIRYEDAKQGVAQSEEVLRIVEVTDSAIPVDWSKGEPLSIEVAALQKEPLAGKYAEAPAPAANPKNYAGWGKELVTWLAGDAGLSLYRSASLKLSSLPHESERDFRLRLQQVARERRDAIAEQLRQKYSSRIASIQERLRRAQAAEQRETAQANRAKMDTLVSFGSTLLGAIMGRKVLSSTNVGRAASTIKGAGRAAEQSADISRAQETVAAVQKQLDELEAELEGEVNELSSALDPLNEPLEKIVIRAKKTNINVRLVALLWLPYREQAHGLAEPVFAW